ncbi:BUG/TctC family periplasmic protein (plasmid) [Cupriavidus sp. U2]|uniref:Bug family tripartite tricarboxylate transporter substrate binding protein n=1 Tax=Cupriavidus sp. U2 TaxID=2920269 RepID=UPI001892B3EB|nr:tripartite tricarboxylate transporter substrate binding protein [Cupriavidus sp. U2]KAI3590369.1 BUG/TctC family periplasmic protein [Cupriavidus sp. U2]
MPFRSVGRLCSRILTLASLGAVAAYAQAATDFPKKPITIVVPYTAGGSSDAVARLLEKPLSQQLGQPVIVDNRPGAGATIGTTLVAKASADGYTVLLADNAQTTAPAMYPRLPYDPVASFKPIGFVGTAPAMLLSSPKSKLRSVRDMVNASAKGSEGFTVGVGSGSPSHLITALFQQQSKLKLQMIPYKGASQAATDVLGGQIDLLFTNPASAEPYIKSGRMFAIGITGTKRLPEFPDVPTFQEQGVQGMEKANYWFALLAPAGLSNEVSQKWGNALATALAMPEITRKLAELGISKIDMTPDKLQRFIAEDRQNWVNIVNASGMKLQ